ncbi:MAG: winged helix-turn-helix domain-containing protein [Promethearchaeota archaeon]
MKEPKDASNPSGEKKNRFEVKIKFWIQDPDEDFTLGKGDVKLLRALLKYNNLTKASKELNYSYKYGWGKLRKISKNTGKAVVITTKGGSGGGGKVELTNWGKYLVELYDTISTDVEDFSTQANRKLHEMKYEETPSDLENDLERKL